MKNYLIAIAATAFAVTGCTQQPAQVAQAAQESNDGMAKSCVASAVDFGTGNAASATINMTNDGWCALHVKDKGGELDLTRDTAVLHWDKTELTRGGGELHGVRFESIRGTAVACRLIGLVGGRQHTGLEENVRWHWGAVTDGQACEVRCGCVWRSIGG